MKNPITDQRREDMLVGALEGGSNYWYLLTDEAVAIIEKFTPREAKKEDITPLSIRMFRAIQAGAVIPIHDIETEELLGSISKQSIKEGEALMLEQQPKHFADIIAEDDDATTADVWLQFCLLKELVYG